MVCLKCGAENADDSKFCAKCRLAATADMPVVKKKVTNILTIVVITLLIIEIGIAAFVMIRLFQPATSENLYMDRTTPLFVWGEGGTQIYNGSSTPITLDGVFEKKVSAIDSPKFAFSIVNDNGSHSLYFYDGMKTEKITDNSDEYWVSSDGSTIAYITDSDSIKNTGTLIIFDTVNRSSKRVSDDVNINAVLSPDGQSYAYISDLKLDANGEIRDYTTYISIDGKEPEPMESGLQVLGISNSANYVYYVDWTMGADQEGMLHVRHGNSDLLLGSTDLEDHFLFNNDCSEIMFSSSGSTYISEDAGDKLKISDHSLCFMIVPYNEKFDYTSCFFDVYVYNVNSLFEHVFVLQDASETSLKYLDREKKFTDIDTIDSRPQIPQFSLNPDGKTLYYLNDSGMITYYENVRDSNSKPVQIGVEDRIKWFDVSCGESVVYFIDESDTLWVKHKYGNPVEVSDNVPTESLKMSPDGKGVYFISREIIESVPTYMLGTLYYLSNTPYSKPSEVADQVLRLDVAYSGICYYGFIYANDYSCNFYGDAFYSPDGKDFTMVMNNGIMI